VPLYLLDGVEDELSEPLLTNRPVVALDVGILLGLAGLDVEDADTALLRLGLQLATDIFRPIVDAYAHWLSAPFDDLVKRANNPGSRKGEVDFDAETFTVEVIKDIQRPEGAAVAELVGHKVHRPHFVRPLRNRQGLRHVPDQPLLRLDPQVQLQFAIDEADAFMVPGKPLHIAQEQVAQAKAPAPCRI